MKRFQVEPQQDSEKWGGPKDPLIYDLLESYSLLRNSVDSITTNVLIKQADFDERVSASDIQEYQRILGVRCTVKLMAGGHSKQQDLDEAAVNVAFLLREDSKSSN